MRKTGVVSERTAERGKKIIFGKTLSVLETMKKTFFASLWMLLAVAGQAKTNEIVVAKDGSGDFRSLQAAINSVRVFSSDSTRILVKNGVYDEKVVIPMTHHRIAIVGEDAEKTVIRNNDYAAKNDMGTFRTYTMLIAGNDIALENLTVENWAGRVGQAVALHTEGDRLVFRNCRIIGNQDTIYTGNKDGRQYYVNCYIEGTTDFIFGPSPAWFEGCELRSKGNSYLTAASTYPDTKFGYVFHRCKLTGDGTPGQRVYLGRPWRPYGATAFLFCELGAHIRPEGWHNWGNPENERTARYAEYKNTGPGADMSGRVSWSRQLTDEEAAAYTVENVFRLQNGWNPAR